jgi:quercetin dioxygenase-like cupin family protein
MKQLIAALLLICQVASAAEITRHGAQPPTPGAARNFIGAVQIDSPFRATAPARVSGATVTFAAGARTAWHSHPLGQTLVVISGCGWVQSEGGPRQDMRAGDVVWIAPGVKHWHGASVNHSVVHVAIVEMLDGRTADWMEQVSETQYGRGTCNPSSDERAAS